MLCKNCIILTVIAFQEDIYIYINAFISKCYHLRCVTFQEKELYISTIAFIVEFPLNAFLLLTESVLLCTRTSFASRSALPSTKWRASLDLVIQTLLARLAFRLPKLHQLSPAPSPSSSATKRCIALFRAPSIRIHISAWPAMWPHVWDSPSARLSTPPSSQRAAGRQNEDVS